MDMDFWAKQGTRRMPKRTNQGLEEILKEEDAVKIINMIAKNSVVPACEEEDQRRKAKWKSSKTKADMTIGNKLCHKFGNNRMKNTNQG